MLGDTINKIRTQAKMTQAQFSDMFGVSQQAIQKWERGDATPSLDKLIMISKYFDISLDELVLGNDHRVVEEMSRGASIRPQYQNLHDWEFYPSNLLIEYQQSLDEGLDIEAYKEVFSSVSSILSHSAREAAMGFSTRTFFPAFMKSIAISACT